MIESERPIEGAVRGPDDAAVAGLIRSFMAGERPALPPCPGPIHLAVRRRGRLVGGLWQEDGDLARLLSGALLLARQSEAETLQIDLCHDVEPVAPDAFARTFRNAAIGLFGLGIEAGGERHLYPPSQMIATNRRFGRVLDLLLAQRGQDRQAFLAGGGRLLRFGARQVLVRLAPQTRAVTLFRGGHLVTPAEIRPQTLQAMIMGMAGWLRANLGADGRMTYKYWPSRGEESSADNTIRQFMATVCLIRLAKRSGDPADLERALRNLRHNLERFYQERDGIGVIAFAGSAKLGAAALAGLAILETPFQSDLQPVLERLAAGVLALWRADGSFRTFHDPPERNDNQNFYPGEALLFCAALHERTRDPALLERCRRTFRWYRAWHRQARNPAFIPWHTQALVRLHAATGDDEMLAFVFEMNDWLCHFQQWETAPYPDLAGRFYDPARPELGPPHASSTGVYLEGLADALRAAEAFGDQERTVGYRRVIWRGLRNLRQLQFKDDHELFYIRRRSRVVGGVRTEAYDNTIRVDNVQHGLMALLKLELMDGFRA